LLANGDELNLNLPKFACPLYLFFDIRFFGASAIEKEIKENSEPFCILAFYFFTAK